MHVGTIENRMLMVKSSLDCETVHSVGGKLDGYGLYELVQASAVGKPCFYVKTKKKPESFVNELTIPNQKIRAVPVERVPWLLPQTPEPYEDETKLWHEVRDCVKQHLDLPNDDDYDVLTAWIMATWLYEKWITFPFLNFHGSMETGKSRSAEVLSRLAFRGWHASFVSVASLYRVCDNWHPTLLLDEVESMLQQPEIVSLLNASYRKGITIPRQESTIDGKFETRFYETFGFRVLSGTHTLPQTLKSRCIVFRMRKAIRPIRLFIDEQTCQKLRNKLLTYRFNQTLKAGDEGHEGDTRRVGADLEELEKFGKELGSGRLAELFYCLWKVAPTPELKAKIIDYAKTLSQERLDELQTSDESLCLSAIIHCITIGKISHGLIFVKDICEEINRSLSYNETWTHRKVGSISSRLGFKKLLGRGKLTCVKFDKKLIDNLKTDPRYASCFENQEDTPTRQDAPSSPSSPDHTRDHNWLQKEPT